MAATTALEPATASAWTNTRPPCRASGGNSAPMTARGGTTAAPPAPPPPGPGEARPPGPAQAAVGQREQVVEADRDDAARGQGGQHPGRTAGVPLRRPDPGRGQPDRAGQRTQRDQPCRGPVGGPGGDQPGD